MKLILNIVKDYLIMKNAVRNEEAEIAGNNSHHERTNLNSHD
jgi:hypothetical protein